MTRLATVYVGRGHRHKFVTTGTNELTFALVMMPGGEDGLDDFFARIGPARRPGEPAPDLRSRGLPTWSGSRSNRLSRLEGRLE